MMMSDTFSGISIFLRFALISGKLLVVDLSKVGEFCWYVELLVAIWILEEYWILEESWIWLIVVAIIFGTSVALSIPELLLSNGELFLLLLWISLF